MPLALVSLAFLAACGSRTLDRVGDARRACKQGAAHLEVADSGRVIRYLGIAISRHGAHEGFVVRFGSGTVARVEDNVDITGPIPLAVNDALSLQGQYECNDGVIHWTHHDPSMRHPAGYVDVGGRRYQ